MITPLQKVQRARVQLLRSDEFCLLSGILMLGEWQMVSSSDPRFAAMPTAATDGINEFYCTEFIEKLDDKTIAFAIAHENFHKLLKHMISWQRLFKENAMLANMAADFVANLMIMQLDPNSNVVKKPDWVLYDEQFKGWSVDQVYKYLKNNPDYAQQQCGGKGGDGEGKPGESFDGHFWEDAGELSDEQRETIEEEIDKAIRQGDIIAGKRAGARARDLGALEDPKIDWKSQLREFVSDIAAGDECSTWRRPNRRHLAQGVYMPSRFSEAVGKVFVGVDTSGSIGNDILRDFLSEIVGICHQVSPSSVELAYWDTQMYEPEVYTRDDYDSLADSTKPVGGGGTDPSGVAKYINGLPTSEKPECVIMLTDGYIFGDFPDFQLPTMWAINTSVVAPHGVTLHI